MKLVFFVPTVAGLLLIGLSVLFFNRVRISAKFLAVALGISALLVFSPFVYASLSLIKDVFGLVYTSVFGLGLALVFLTALVIYLVLKIGELKSETKELWQELSILNSQFEDDKGDL